MRLRGIYRAHVRPNWSRSLYPELTHARRISIVSGRLVVDLWTQLTLQKLDIRRQRESFAERLGTSTVNRWMTSLPLWIHRHVISFKLFALDLDIPLVPPAVSELMDVSSLVVIYSMVGPLISPS